MITRPDIAQLAVLIREDLRRVPTLDDAGRAEVLALGDGLLGVIARRATSQPGWMREEIEQIDELLALLDAGGLVPDPPAATADATPDDLERRYRERSAALAAAVPAAMTAGGEARRRLDAVIATRVEHEQAIRGDVSIVRDAQGGHA